jgi:hypothetical protein
MVDDAGLGTKVETLTRACAKLPVGVKREFVATPRQPQIDIHP